MNSPSPDPVDTPLTVLVVDDEPDLVELIAYNLRQRGHRVLTASDGETALSLAGSRRLDLVVLDVMMPRLSGVEVARRLRSQRETELMPIIMLTARSEEAHELEGLGAGADDYIAKPFSMRVLLARIEALARRASAATTTPARTLELGPVSIDLDEHRATVDGKAVALTVTEFRLLSTLIDAGGRVLSRPALIAGAIGAGVTVTERTIDVHITALRRKIAPYSAMIDTVRGVGYRAVAPASAGERTGGKPDGDRD